MAREQSERRFTGLPVPVSVTVDPWETDLADRRQQALLLDWRTKVSRDSTDRTLYPALEAIDQRITKALGDGLTLLDLIDGGDFRFRAVSKGAVDIINKNLTGMKLSEMPPQIASILRDAYNIVIDAGQPVYTRHVMRGGKTDGQRWQRICLPMCVSGVPHRIGALLVHTHIDMLQRNTAAGAGRGQQGWKQGDPIWDV